MKIFDLLLVLLSGIGITAINNGCSQTGSKKITGNLLNLRLDSVFASQRKDDPGGSILILKNNEVLYSKSFGLAELKTHTKFTSKTVSNLGSISKTFVAYGILILQKEGKLSLEDSIIRYFPDFKNKEIACKVKIKHLLTHTSGLPDSRKTREDSIFYLSAKDEENFAPLKQTDSLEFEPGSNWNYSNPAFNGLALIIEKISGMKWQQFIQENIFKPAGMLNSKITDGPYPESGVAHGYRKRNNSWQEYDYGEYPTFAASGNGGVWSSVDELGKYVDAMKKGIILDCETIKLSQTAWVPGNWKSIKAPAQGFSWFVHKTDSINKNLCIEHAGDQGGFRAHLLMFPDADLTIIWLSNNEQVYTPPVLKVLIELNYLN